MNITRALNRQCQHVPGAVPVRSTWRLGFSLYSSQQLNFWFFCFVFFTRIQCKHLVGFWCWNITQWEASLAASRKMFIYLKTESEIPRLCSSQLHSSIESGVGEQTSRAQWSTALNYTALTEPCFQLSSIGNVCKSLELSGMFLPRKSCLTPTAKSRQLG